MPVTKKEECDRYMNTSDPEEVTGFVFDYMLKDHLGNVRAVITEGQKIDIYPIASMEDNRSSKEEKYYSIDNTKIVSASSLVSAPSPYENNNYPVTDNPEDPVFEQTTSAKLYQLNKNTNKTGLGITLKVMAGDRIDIFGKSYWYESNTGGNAANASPAVLDLLTALLGAPTGGIAAGKTNAAELASITDVNNPVGSFLNDNNRNDPNNANRPKAFINYIFLDEQFRPVAGNMGFSPVNEAAGLKDHYSELQNRVAAKNGYVYIYVSNESPVNVFFDNLQVVHTKSPILEETHYYPFGLTMAGISSKALTCVVENKSQKFQNQPLEDDLELNLYGFKWRNHDPQIGRFLEIDPLSEKYVHNSTYAFSENKVIAHVELEGLEAVTANGLMQSYLRQAGINSNTATKVEESVKNGIEVAGRISKDILVISGGVVVMISFRHKKTTLSRVV